MYYISAKYHGAMLQLDIKNTTVVISCKCTIVHVAINGTQQYVGIKRA